MLLDIPVLSIIVSYKKNPQKTNRKTNRMLNLAKTLLNEKTCFYFFFCFTYLTQIVIGTMNIMKLND